MKNMFNLKNKKGFTLVELLAVIVIIAILITIGTPIASNIIDDSKKSAFASYVDKIYEDAVKQYETDIHEDYTLRGLCVVYDIENSLGLADTGDNEGYVLVRPGLNGHKYYMNIHNKRYMVNNYEYDNNTKTKITRYIKGDKGFTTNIESYAMDEVGCMSFICYKCNSSKYSYTMER